MYSDLWFIIPFARFPLDTGFKPNPLPEGMILLEQSGQLLLTAVKEGLIGETLESRDIARSWFSLKVPMMMEAQLRQAVRHADIMTNALVLCENTVFFRKYGFICTEKDGKYQLRNYMSYPADLIYPSAYDNGRLTQDKLDLAARLFENMKDVYFDQTSRVAASLQYFWSGCHGRWTTQKIMAHWAGLESLFGSFSDISFKLKHRISFFLEDNPDNRLALAAQISDSYRIRNKIAHGTPFFSFKPQSSNELRADSDLLFVTNLHKQVLKKVLLDKTWWPIFDGKRREEAFDEALLLGKKDAR